MYIDEIKAEEMTELVNDAKKQVKEWNSPDTKREFIKTEIWSASRQFPDQEHPGHLTEMYVLEGGEAKGTIIADYFNGVVIAFDKYNQKMMIHRTMFNDRRRGEEE